MAKIIHVSNFGRKPKGAFQHSVENKLSNGLIRNGHYVANFSDRDAARQGAWIGHRKFGVSAANKMLRDFCYNIRPDLLLLGHADVIKPETLAAIRSDQPSIKIVQWNVDAMFVPDNIRRISSKLEVVDATLVSTAGEALAPLTKIGHGFVGYMPNPVDFSVESGRNFEKTDLPYDLFFPCGNPTATRQVCGANWLPETLIEQIEKQIPGIRCLVTGIRGVPLLAGAAYQAAMESAAIGLNLSRESHWSLYSSDRLAQMCGNGMAIVMDRATGFGELIADDAFAFYSSFEQMIEIIRRLKTDQSYRQALAKAGRERYHALFNEQVIARYIMEVAFDTLRESDYLWPTRFKPPA